MMNYSDAVEAYRLCAREEWCSEWILFDIVVADPTRRDLVECAARHDLVGAIDAERRKESHY